jgi:hypothetical protein
MNPVIRRGAINLALLAVVIAFWLTAFATVRGSNTVPPMFGDILYGTLLYWGAMLVPTLAFLFILERLPDRWPPLSRRLVAVTISPIRAFVLYVAATRAVGNEPLLLLIEGLSLPLAYGALVRLRGREPRQARSASES